MGKNYYSMYDKEKKKEEMKTEEKPVDDKEIITEKKSTMREEKHTVVKKAKVIDCVRLNIRETPDTQAKILTTVNVGVEIIVDDASSDKNWCGVKLPNGLKGYAMRKFLKIL